MFLALSSTNTVGVTMDQPTLNRESQVDEIGPRAPAHVGRLKIRSLIFDQARNNLLGLTRPSQIHEA